MLVTALLKQAQLDGVWFILDGDRIGLRGDPAMVQDWAPRLKVNKLALLSVLRDRDARTHKSWRVHVSGHEPSEIVCVQGWTRTALLARYADGTRVEGLAASSAVPQAPQPGR